MNRTIKLLILSDIFILTGYGLIAPILAIFFKENLTGGTIFTAGLATSIFLVTKSLIQIPFAKYIDSHDHKVRLLIAGTFLICLVPFIYMIATDIKHIYIAELVHALGGAMAFPTWLGLFSTHLDKKHESYEWSIYSTSAGIGAGLTGAAGAAFAQYVGFRETFAIVGLLSLIGCYILFFLEKKQEKITKIPAIHYHRKRKIMRGRQL